MHRLDFVMVYLLWRCTLCEVYVLKTLHFGTLTLCAATFYNSASCNVYVMLLCQLALRHVTFMLCCFVKLLWYSTNDPTQPVHVAVIIRQSRWTSHGLGHHLGPPLALVRDIYFLFCLLSRNYFTSGCFSWCKLFLLINSCNFWAGQALLHSEK